MRSFTDQLIFDRSKGYAVVKNLTIEEKAAGYFSKVNDEINSNGSSETDRSRRN